jgi:broad specificity phosphatase PhoE
LEPKWPQTLRIVRRGQSAGKLARDAAELAGLAAVEIAARDVDLPRSRLGERQADALGERIAALRRDNPPEIVHSSPCIGACQTGGRVLAALHERRRAHDRRDEPPREKEFGIFDRLTPLGIRAGYPQLAGQRRHVGKFYFRPPRGEDRRDVVLRLRSFFDLLQREHRGARALASGHQAIVSCLRPLFERLDEAQIVALDRLGGVPDCAIAADEFDPRAARHGKVLRLESLAAPPRAAGAPPSAAPDRPAAPRP